jgi:hypothetical protein
VTLFLANLDSPDQVRKAIYASTHRLSRHNVVSISHTFLNLSYFACALGWLGFLQKTKRVLPEPTASDSRQAPVLCTDMLTYASVLPPPPPRYTVPVAYAAGASNGMAVPIVETNNIITHPENGCPLQVGEGTLERCMASAQVPANSNSG